MQTDKPASGIFVHFFLTADTLCHLYSHSKYWQNVYQNKDNRRNLERSHWGPFPRGSQSPLKYLHTCPSSIFFSFPHFEMSWGDPESVYTYVSFALCLDFCTLSTWAFPELWNGKTSYARCFFSPSNVCLLNQGSFPSTFPYGIVKVHFLSWNLKLAKFTPYTRHL